MVPERRHASQAATVHTRAGENRNTDILVGDVDLALPEPGIAVPLREPYEDVEFAPGGDEAASG